MDFSKRGLGIATSSELRWLRGGWVGVRDHARKEEAGDSVESQR